MGRYDLDGDIENYDLIIENTSNGEEIKYEKIIRQNFEVELQKEISIYGKLLLGTRKKTFLRL